MPRKLKVYQTSLGFFDLAIAAPSMKAALKAWGASESNLFQQGFAKQSDDREVIAAAMAQPGVVLRRPVGSNKRFQEHAKLPSAESLAKHSRPSEVPRKKTKTLRSKKTDEKAERKAAAKFEKEEHRRERQRQKQEKAAVRVRAGRHAAMEKAKSTLENARREHDKRAALIENERDAVERRAKAEEIRWQKLESRLERAVQKASRW
jgi:colicin import membrane protein